MFLWVVMEVRRRLWSSPTAHYESVELELSRDWEPQTVRELHLSVKEKNPHFLFLMETKIRTEYLQRLRIKFGYEGLFTVDPLGKSGGLALF
jgi:hypothetical protein